jgi:integrase/recombinase XerD
MTASTRTQEHRITPRMILDEEVNQFRAWLEANDYGAKLIRQHIRHLGCALQMMRETGGQYTPSQLAVAFGKIVTRPAQRRVCCHTQGRFQAYLAAQGRLTVPVETDRFAVLRSGYHRELVEVRGFSHSSVRWHDATVEDFLKRGLRRRQALRALTCEDIDRYVALKAAENSRQSLQHVVAVLRSFLRYCWDQHQIPHPLDGIDTPRVYRDELLPRALAWPTVQRLLRSIDRRHGTGERDYAILHLMAHYGLRPAEIASLRVDAIDWREQTLRVEQRKTRSALILPLTTATIRILHRHLRCRRGRDASKYAELFLRAHCPYGPLKSTAVGERFAARAQECGLGNRKYSAYSLRHAFAMRLLERGVGVKAIGDVMGHRSLESTCVYLRLDINALRQVALEVPRQPQGRGGDHA